MAWKHGRSYWAHVRRRDGSRKRCQLGTDSKVLAREIERMLSILHGRREWDLLQAVADGPLTVGELFDHWRGGSEQLDLLRARLNDVDLNDYVEGWQRWARRRAKSETVSKYTGQLRVLIPEPVPFPRSGFTRKKISEKLSDLPGSGTTARRYHAAWSSFANYLVEVEVLDSNPLRLIKAPRPNLPKELYLELHDVVRLIDAQPEPYRTIAALREGAGVEISAALGVRRGDVDIAKRIVFVRGTKNVWRTRPVLVDEWAIPYLERFIRDKALMPAALLFEGVKPRSVWEVNRRTVRELKLDERYTLHDSRHSFAVRWMKAGIDPQLIANNLGHKDASLVMRVYGKYRPTLQDLARIRTPHTG